MFLLWNKPYQISSKLYLASCTFCFLNLFPSGESSQGWSWKAAESWWVSQFPNCRLYGCATRNSTHDSFFNMSWMWSLFNELNVITRLYLQRQSCPARIPLRNHLVLSGNLVRPFFFFFFFCHFSFYFSGLKIIILWLSLVSANPNLRPSKPGSDESSLKGFVLVWISELPQLIFNLKYQFPKSPTTFPRHCLTM